MNRKLLVIVAILAAAVVMLVGYNAFIAPEGVAGEKDVTIQVVNEDIEMDRSFEYSTDHEFLFDLMEEHEDELGMEYDSGEFGNMIVSMNGYRADDSEQEFYHIAVNGEDANTGVSEIPINDGDVYKFEIMNY